MTTTLNQISVGIVGASPQLFLMETSLTADQVTTPGFVNALQHTNDITIAPNDIIFAKFVSPAEKDSVMYAATFGAEGVITLVDMSDANNPPGPGGFIFENTWFVAAGGLPGNTGKTINDPFPTFQDAIDAAEATPQAAGIKKTIVGFDGNIYTDDITISQLNLNVYAPNAALSVCNVTLSASATTVSTDLAQNILTFDRWRTVTYNDTTVASPTVYNDIQLNVSEVYASTVNLGTRSCSLNFNTWDFAANSINSSVNGNNLVTYYTFNINNPLNSNAEDALSNINLNTWVRVNGHVGNQVISFGLRFVQDTSADLSLKWGGSIVYGTPSGNIDYNISVSLNAQAPLGWEALVIREGGNGNIRLVTDSGATIVSVPNNPETAGDGGWFIVKKMDVNLWFCGGAIQNTGFSAANAQVFVSQLAGSDVDGDGTLANPYASFTHALTQIGTPTVKTTIIALDDETYTGNINITEENINISAPNATFTAATGNVFEVSSSPAGFVSQDIRVGTILATGSANSIVSSSSDHLTLFVYADSILGGAIECDTGTVAVSCGLCSSDKTITTDGTIYYFALQNSGTNTVAGGEISGLTPKDTTAKFTAHSDLTVSGELNVSNYTMPLTDGTVGQAIVTDGAGTLSFATVSGGGGIAWSGIAGTTQAAAVNNGYVVQNAAQTTITLPATMVLGDVVIVKGLGAAGWIVQANSGQTVHVGAVDTSVAGTITSANQYDVLSVTCVVDNTEWSMDYSVTSGFAIA